MHSALSVQVKDWIILWVFTYQNRDVLTGDAVVEASGKFVDLGLLNVH